MAWINLTAPAAGDPTEVDFAEDVVNDLAFLYNQFLSVVGAREVVLNGSFESDADNDSFPDGWTPTEYTGGDIAWLESTVAADGKAWHGKRSLSFTSPGGGAPNGGGYITGDNFIEVSEGRPYKIQFAMKSSVADVHNKCEILWYDCTQTSISTSTVYDDAASNPTSWAIFEEIIFPPANARYAKFRFYGCVNDDATAGVTYLDDVRINAYEFPREVQFTVAGTFKWKCPFDCEYIHVIAIGGGGGGGGSNTQAAAGGGSGGMAIGTIAVTAGTVYSIVVGPGGAGGSVVPSAGSAGTASTFSTISGGGGGGGASTSGSGGTGGTASGGNINKNGNAGNVRVSSNDGGYGGPSVFSGDVSAGGIDAGNIAPEAGRAYGAGGGGSSADSTIGGAGATGAVIIRF